MLNSKTFLSISTAAAIVVAPMLAFGQTAPAPNNARGGMTAQTAPDGAPGNPPSTATQRAVDGMTGNRTSPDGTGNNPPGTAVGRAIDRATTGTTATGTTATGTTGTGTTATGTTTTGTTTTGTTATGTTTPSLSVDSMSLRESRRASEIIGSNIYNEENDSIGEVEDLIVPQGGRPPVAVISVGGFLGIGAKLVAIPYERLSHDSERGRWMLRGATKESLESLPSFSYDNAARRG